MTLDELKDAIYKVSMGRRDACNDLAEYLHEMLSMLERKVPAEELVAAAVKAKKAAK